MLHERESLDDGVRSAAVVVRTERTDAEWRTLYCRAMGADWDALPSSLKRLHDVRTVHHHVGHADVYGADNLFAQTIARIIGFPETSADIPVHVQLETDGMRETWTRTFGDQTFCSTQELGTGRFAGLLVERFGAFAFGLAVVVTDGILSLDMRHWSLLGVPLPLCMAPISIARESDVEGRFHFDVEISLPLVGRLVHYVGNLAPLEDTHQQSSDPDAPDVSRVTA